MSSSDAFWLSIAAVAIVSSAAATGWACRWWYGRKLTAAAQRLRKSDQGRLFSQQQVQDARRQIEALKRELAAERALVSKSQAGNQRARELEAQLRIAEKTAADYASRPMPLAPAHGFADTQILN